MTLENIAKAIDEASEKYGYNCFGIRTGKAAEVGSELESSYVWDNNQQTDEQLDGTCSTGIARWWDESGIENAMKKHNSLGYSDEMTYIIGGKDSEYGEDESELIIKSAHVICVISAS